MTNNLKIIERTDDELRVGNHIVLFGGRDLDGEHFTADTELASPFTKGVGRLPVDWEHGYASDGEPQRDDVLGFVDWSTAKTTDRGVFVERVLNRQAEYFEFIEELIEAGVIGTSSEAISSKVQKTDDGQITVWPLKRDALTVTPAEPRMLSENSLSALKSLSHFFPHLKSYIPEGDAQPEDAGEASEPAQPDVTIEINVNTPEETKNMSEQELETPAAEAAPEVDVKAIMDELQAMKAWRELQEATPVNDPGSSASKGAPAFNKTSPGDSLEQEYIHYLKSGRESMHFRNSLKASNDTDMSIGTAADGGNAVPTPHHNQIIERRDQMALHSRLGVRPFGGTGTTLSVPIDNEADGEWVSTAEAGGFDRDAPEIDNKDLTLVKYTKKIEVSVELLDDEDAGLLGFLTEWVGRGLAKTENNLLITEASGSGAELKEFASDTVIATGELEDIVGNNNLDPYLDDSSSVAWITRNSTKWDIMSLVGDQRQYAESLSLQGPNQLLGYPVFTTDKVAAPASDTNSIYFGNWFYMARREGPTMQVLRDPFSKAANGQVVFHYFTRVVYGVLQAEAIGIGNQAT